MDIPQRELATTNAANRAIPNFDHKLNCKTTPIKVINEAIIPLFGIIWDLSVARRVGDRLLRRILRFLRNSELSEKAASELANSGKHRYSIPAMSQLNGKLEIDK